MSKVIKVDFKSRKKTEKGIKDVGFGQEDKKFPPSPVLRFPSLTEADKLRVDLISIEKDIIMMMVFALHRDLAFFF